MENKQLEKVFRESAMRETAEYCFNLLFPETRIDLPLLIDIGICALRADVQAFLFESTPEEVEEFIQLTRDVLIDREISAERKFVSCAQFCTFCELYKLVSCDHPETMLADLRTRSGKVNESNTAHKVL
jgi:hypothetical protein